MIGILVLLTISWLLLYFLENKNLLILGVFPITKRVLQFITGFLISATLCIIAQLIESNLQSSQWILNDNSNTLLILQSFWWDFKSVLTEELLFRGAILYVFIKRFGTRKAISISAISFGIYHWFSFGVFGNIVPMILIFLGTGIMGYAWALTYARTKSILMAFGFHLGWNFVYNTIFSKGPLGELLLVSEGGNNLSGWLSSINFLIGLMVIPILELLYVKYFVKNESNN